MGSTILYKRGCLKLHFIQGEATPHNNLLIKELAGMVEIELTLWYAREDSEQYTWAKNPTHEIQQAQIYGDRNIHWPLVLHLLRRQTEKVFQVGWANPTTRMLVVLFFLFRRPYNMWTDYPNDAKKRSRITHYLRELFYYLLKHSKANVFCVGKMTVDYFVRRGFSKVRLFNLPIFVSISKTKDDYIKKKGDIYNKYNIKDEDFFLTAGSRLTYEKGFDILVEAINLLPHNIKKDIKCLIVGKGEEKQNLTGLIKKYCLETNILIEEWMEIDDFKACIANSDLFIHPARFDAYGAGTLNAMIVGVSVIASLQSGSGPDRIVHNKNGWLYDAQDINSLTGLIEMCYKNHDQLKIIGKAARETAEKYSSYQGAQIVTREIL
jgi:glycosyltransferase involved in cell wall biosynthesis